MRTPGAGDFIAYLTTEAPGAMPNGMRVVKIAGDASDTHSIGAKATILGSMMKEPGDYGYFVEWDDMPGVPVACSGWKLKRYSDA